MKFAFARFFFAALAVTLVAASAAAQNGGGGRHQRQKTEKTVAQKPKADEKAYKAALTNLPDKPFDPWHNVR